MVARVRNQDQPLSGVFDVVRLRVMGDGQLAVHDSSIAKFSGLKEHFPDVDTACNELQRRAGQRSGHVGLVFQVLRELKKV
ncbi:MAG TPA: hypothetical protein PKI93_06405 [Alphaproteobacteria bacterium]|nr:hypothetical protein [Alphaproteobacteria bacterium]HNS44163.1 hypothetical protein [Alphaproteobacteria bacterium]